MAPPAANRAAISDAVRGERSRQRLTQRELAFAAGVDTGVVQQLEAHSGRGVSIDRCLRVLDALGMRVVLVVADPSAHELAVDPGAPISPASSLQSARRSPRRADANGTASPRRRGGSGLAGGDSRRSGVSDPPPF